MTRYKIVWTESESRSEYLSEEEVRRILFKDLGIGDDGTSLEVLIEENADDFLGAMFEAGHLGKGHYFESEFYDATAISENLRPRTSRNVMPARTIKPKAKTAPRKSPNTKAKPKAPAKKKAATTKNAPARRR